MGCEGEAVTREDVIDKWAKRAGSIWRSAELAADIDALLAVERQRCIDVVTRLLLEEPEPYGARALAYHAAIQAMEGLQ